MDATQIVSLFCMLVSNVIAEQNIGSNFIVLGNDTFLDAISTSPHLVMYSLPS